ncbi:MAG: head-tail connector protein [Defluviitaleaceae bacterium]|nr:head-tail connector protein [Defluviitaleaceae bacterium]MCL2263781.1 head-tail connector protein [Defluviitaleaceae bacterium]
MKVSEITNATLSKYLRLDDVTDEEKTLLDTLIGVAKAFIGSYTGLDEDDIEKHDEFVIVVFILVQDMFDNRVLYVDKSNMNRTVETILGMHSVNLL